LEKYLYTYFFTIALFFLKLYRYIMKKKFQAGNLFHLSEFEEHKKGFLSERELPNFSASVLTR
jgi:hypothetical protein